MLETRNLSFSYPGGRTFRFPDLTLEKGDQLILTGNSGSGKTTLLHLIAGILKADTGSVKINGFTIQKPGFSGMDAFRGTNIGLIFQKHLFIDSLCMADNLHLARSVAGLYKDKNYPDILMAELEISHLKAKYPRMLSQGELQRFSVARALANKPSLILADEPTSSLDDDNCHRFITLLKDLSQKHQSALVLATHDSRLKNEFERSLNLTETL